MFGAQVTWQLFPFGPILGHFLPVSDFEASAGIKIEEDTENGMSRVTGRELQTCGFSIHVSKLTGGNPWLTFEALKRLKGVSAPLYLSSGTAWSLSNSVLDTLQTSDWRQALTLNGAIGLAKSLFSGTSLGGVSFMLTDVSLEIGMIGKDGEIIDAMIYLSFTEDAGERQSGGLRVFINDEDITSSISVTGCIYEMHAEGEADSLEIHFADTKRRWVGWKPSKEGDTVKITDGVVNSGVMFIESLKPSSGEYTLRAFSVPKSATNKKSRSFENMSLPQLAATVARDNKLSVKNYGVSGIKYPYVQQRGKSDLAFLHERCKFAGASFLIYDKTLCLYDEKTMENRDCAKILTLGPTVETKFTDDAHTAYSSAKVRNSSFTGTGSDGDVKTGKELVTTISEMASTQAVANRISQAILRDANKKSRRGEVCMNTQRELAAGSVVQIIANGWMGPAFIYRCRHDLKAKKTRFWIRKPLSY